MSERIIYADRPFRDEFIEEIHTIAPGYVFKTELQPEELPNVEINMEIQKVRRREVFAALRAPVHMCLLIVNLVILIGGKGDCLAMRW